MNRIETIRIESLVHREDGKIVEYGTPVPCEICGKLCTVKVHHMSTGHRAGADCAVVVECITGMAPMTAEQARSFRANKRQIGWLRSLGFVTTSENQAS